MFQQAPIKPLSDYMELRKRISAQRDNIEKALTRFIAMTGATENLFAEDPYAFPCKLNLCHDCTNIIYFRFSLIINFQVECSYEFQYYFHNFFILIYQTNYFSSSFFSEFQCKTRYFLKIPYNKPPNILMYPLHSDSQSVA